jgi:Ca2+-transporting ATPase
MRAERDEEVPFDPARGFHSSVLGDRLLVKGAAESLAPRCQTVRREGRDMPLGSGGASELLDAAERLASKGLRVLMVAQGTPTTAPDDPEGLVAIGLVGISDPTTRPPRERSPNRQGYGSHRTRCSPAPNWPTSTTASSTID